MGNSFLATVGNAIAWIFAPLGWGNWQAAVGAFTGLVAKENIVATLGIFYGGGEESAILAIGNAFTVASGFSFLVFNLLCAPCFAAMGAIRREMHSGKWTLFAIGYQCVLAYATSFCIFQIGSLISAIKGGTVHAQPIVGAGLSALIIAGVCYMLFKPYKEATRLDSKVYTK